MSEPKRYNFSATIVHHIDGEMTAAIKYNTEPDGLFVSYEDYARLKAEVERLDALCKQLGKQHSDISCENIMLRKAGDAMADRLMYQGYPATVPDWNAAKEGKGQS
jgi:hypothetical protein